MKEMLIDLAKRKACYYALKLPVLYAKINFKKFIPEPFGGDAIK